MQELSWAKGNELLTTFGAQRHLVERIGALMEARGWSQSELARRMSAAHHPIGQSAISRILGQERRQVTIDELIGFAKVFEVPAGELLLPAVAVSRVEAMQLVAEGAEMELKLEQLLASLHYRARKVAEVASEDPELAAYLTALDSENPRDPLTGLRRFMMVVRRATDQLQSDRPLADATRSNTRRPREDSNLRATDF